MKQQKQSQAKLKEDVKIGYLTRPRNIQRKEKKKVDLNRVMDQEERLEKQRQCQEVNTTIKNSARRDKRTRPKQNQWRHIRELYRTSKQLDKRPQNQSSCQNKIWRNGNQQRGLYSQKYTCFFCVDIIVHVSANKMEILYKL